MSQFKAAADLKLEGAVDPLEGQDTMQRDPERLEHWISCGKGAAFLALGLRLCL